MGADNRPVCENCGTRTCAVFKDIDITLCPSCKKMMDKGILDVIKQCSKCGKRVIKYYYISNEINCESCSLKEGSRIVQCPDCGKDVSIRATTCLNCGCPINPIPIQQPIQQPVPTGKKCPHCGSIYYHKISFPNKAGSALLFGPLAIGHIAKTFKCNKCGYKW